MKITRPSFLDLSNEVVLPEYGGDTTFIDGKRHYATPGSSRPLPSVSTVMGYDPEKDRSLDQWRERVGKENADHITTQSQTYGTTMHDWLECYLRNDVDSIHQSYENMRVPDRYTPLVMFNTIKAFCDKNVDGVYHQETPVYSNVLGVAGRFDCLCRMNSSPVLMDFKNSRKRKKKEWVQNYCLQCTAYADIIMEHCNINIEWFVIPIAIFSGELQVVTGRVAEYRPAMRDQICRYYDEVVYEGI